HVNMAQSSNDTFPTAMHIAAVRAIREDVLPSVAALRQAITAKAERWRDVVKIGRTHLEDAVPLTVGQEWSGYARQLELAAENLRSEEHTSELQSRGHLVCRLLLEKKKKNDTRSEDYAAADRTLF